METQSKAPLWQRVLSASLAVAGVWALSRPELYDRIEFPGSLLSGALALAGLYLFGHFAIRGRLPKSLSLASSDGNSANDGNDAA